MIGRLARPGEGGRRPQFTILTIAGALLTAGLGAAGPSGAATSGTFAATGSMHAAQTEGKAALLQNGQLLVTRANCGGGAPALPTPELYDPATGTFTRTGSMQFASAGASATLLDNSQVLIASGAAELYNLATGKFTLTGSVLSGYEDEVGTLLPDGDMLVTGKGQVFAEL